MADVVFGSSKKVVDALKQIFRHDYDVLVYKSGTTEISPERFIEDKEELSSNATLSISLLKALLRCQKLDTESVNIFVKILLSFDFVYVKGKHGLPNEHGDNEAYDIVDHWEKADACLLVPWLLNQGCPREVEENFPTDCPKGSIEVTLSYSFAFALPLGIFQRFSAKCHQISQLIRHWNNGFTLSYGPIKAKFTCEERATNAAIICKCRTPKSRNALDRLFHVFWRCIVQLHMLLSTFPGSLYSIYFDYCDGDTTMKKERVEVSSQDWDLRTLGRLFHLFWRCIVHLHTLLSTSLYSIFLDYSDHRLNLCSDGDTAMKKQRVQISSQYWDLKTLGPAKPRKLEECSNSIRRGINRSLG